MKIDSHNLETELYKLLERKVNLLDVQEALSQKADHRELANLPTKSEVHEISFKVDRIAKELQGKMQIRGNKLNIY